MKTQIEKNLPILANMMANIFGVVMINLIQGDFIEILAPESLDSMGLVGMIFDPLIFSFGIVAALIFERPIRRYFSLQNLEDAPQAKIQLAKKRVLLIPYFYMVLNLIAWLSAAIVYPLVLSYSGAPVLLVVRLAAQCIIVGLITCSLAFFLVEAILQKFYMPRFFPKGGVFAVSGVPRIVILTRLVVLFIISGFVPCVVSLLMASGAKRMLETGQLDTLVIVDYLSSGLAINALAFIVTGLMLAVLVSITLAHPFKVIISALQNIEQGNLNVWLPTHSTDEVGYTCESINKMADGLREKERLRKSLDLAGIVQKSLLPDSHPQVEGVDIVGLSLPCDETGGDFYDFIMRGDDDSIVDIIVGDVVGHGVSSALLMTSVRAMLRTRSEIGGSYADIVEDVNRLLCKDVRETGHFVTMFYLGYDAASNMLSWVRAGHDPAFLYNTKTGVFQELKEGGPALGIEEDAVFTYGSMSLEEGMILLIGTDGIWETNSTRNGFYGKERVKEIMQAQAENSAQQILDSVMNSLEDFRGVDPVEDDTTVVVLKAER